MAGGTRDVRSEAVRDRILDGAGKLLAAGEELTFARLAKVAEIPERTLYRYFESREALFAGVFEWANRQIGFAGEPPADAAAAIALVRKVFPGFDLIAPIVHEILVAPEGRAARRQHLDKRQHAAAAIVKKATPGLDRATARRVAALVQVMTIAATWQAFRDYWDMDGEEAAETAALGIELVLEGAAARARARS